MKKMTFHVFSVALLSCYFLPITYATADSQAQSACTDFYESACSQSTNFFDQNISSKFENKSLKQAKIFIDEKIKNEIIGSIDPNIKSYYDSCKNYFSNNSEGISSEPSLFSEIENKTITEELIKKINPLQIPYLNLNFIIDSNNKKILYIINSSLRKKYNLTEEELKKELENFFINVTDHNHVKSKLFAEKILLLERIYKEKRDIEADDNLKINNSLDSFDFLKLSDILVDYTSLNLKIALQNLDANYPVYINKEFMISFSNALNDIDTLKALILVNNKFNITQIKNSIHNYNQTEIEKNCISITKNAFPNSLAFKTLNGTLALTLEDKNNVLQITNNLKLSLKNYIDKMDVSNFVKEGLKEKVNSITFEISSPNTETQANWNIENYLPFHNQDFEKNQNSIFQQRVENFSELSNKTSSNNFWYPSSPLDSNAFYYGLQNKVYISRGLLVEPFYSKNDSGLKNYARLGTIIAKQMAHTIDEDGLMDFFKGEDKIDYLGDYYEIVLKHFAPYTQSRNMLKSEIDQYNSTIEGEKIPISTAIDHAIEHLDENMTDYIALQIAYNAALEKGLLNTQENKKMFYHYNGQNLCINGNFKDIKNKFTIFNPKDLIFSKDNDYKRLQIQTKTSREFKEIFQCIQNTTSLNNIN